MKERRDRAKDSGSDGGGGGGPFIFSTHRTLNIKSQMNNNNKNKWINNTQKTALVCFEVECIKTF